MLKFFGGIFVGSLLLVIGSVVYVARLFRRSTVSMVPHWQRPEK